MITEQGYWAYGRYRGGHELGTENRFTGQKLDGAGLMYFNARYYDPELGQFLSPDTLVPDPTNLFAWNRYMYTIGNPLRYNDPSGHNWEDVIVTVVDFAQGVGAQVGYNNTVVALPSEINSFAPQAGESTSMQVGRFVGNVVTAVQGVAEISGGAGLGGAGVAACATGVGCVATAPAVVGASAVIAHGATVATIGAVNAGTQLGNAVMAMMEGGSSGGTEGNSESKRALQTGGNTLEKRTLKELGLSKEQGKQAIEGLKRDLGVRNNFHGKIWNNGDVTDPKTGEVLGNLFDYVD